MPDIYYAEIDLSFGPTMSASHFCDQILHPCFLGKLLDKLLNRNHMIMFAVFALDIKMVSGNRGKFCQNILARLLAIWVIWAIYQETDPVV
jgi:hypothetical protein